MKAILSQSQLGVYYACVSSMDKEVNYQNPVLFALPEKVDVTRLQKAVSEALNAHAYLLSRVVLDENGEPRMDSDGLPAKVEVLQVTEEEWAEVQKSFAQTMDIYGERLYRAEIYVVGTKRLLSTELTETTERLSGTGVDAYLYLDFHHVLADGFTIVLMLKEIERAYSGRKPAGEMTSGEEVAQAEESQRSDEAMMTEAKEWYAKEFADAAEVESVPLVECPNTDTSTSRNIEYCYKHYPLSVTKAEMQGLVKRFGVTEHVITEAAWGLLSAAYTAEEAASFCTVYWGRSDRRTLMTASMMVHTLPVFVKLKINNYELRIEELLKALNEQTEKTRKYQYYAYQDAVRDLGLNNQVMFVYQGAVLADKRGLHLDGVSVPYTDLRQPTPGWKLCAELFEHEDVYSLKLGYSTADYSDAYMQQLAKTCSAILRSMAKAEFVRNIEYCDAEQTAWLDGLNPETVVLPETDGLVARFKQRVKEQPDAVCVVAGEKRLTYAEVDALTDAIDPNYATQCGEFAVGYSVPRNEQMVLVPLAIAKAGKTLLPLDSSYPPERLEYMKQDAAKCDKKEAFVLLYTSGTTGEPKGVMLSERNVLAFCDFHCRHFGIDNHSRYASYAGYGFDAYQQDLWCSLINGAAIYILSDEVRFDLEAMRAYFDENGITNAFMTTQVATQMAINYPEMKTLRTLGTGGEKLMSFNPPKTYRLNNGYGPTESIAYVCSYWVDKNEPNIPIGKPNDTTRMYIVNKYGKRLPWGAAGELLVAGEQVSLGYLNKPEKTAESFVHWNNERVYRTGDIVRYREDGNIEFVGRKDGQVKIRGFRIELKEVEGVIREYPGIKDATVQAFEQEGGGKFIAAYIVSDEKIETQALNAFIMDRKPPYMVPAVTMQIDAIPLNQNQKVNKRALPKPEVQRDDVQSTKEAAPLNVLEEELHGMVEKIVSNADFGITTDLRMVGLTSISAIKLATQVFKRYGVQLDAKQLTKGITIQAIENEILATLLNKGGIDMTTSRHDDMTKETVAIGEAPLSFAQTGVYFECMKNPTSTLYNIPMRLTLPTEISDEQLRQAVEKVVANHLELHVRFKTNESGVIQTVERGELKIESLQMTEEQAEAYKTEFVRPFNLHSDLLCRFAIVRTIEEPMANGHELKSKLYLYCDIHHLVCDGASYDIFFNELSALLDGQTIEPEICTYAQFVAEQKTAEESEAFAASAEFFRSRLGETDGATELTADLTNPKPQGETAYVSAPFDMKKVEQLCQIANRQSSDRQSSVTPAALSLAAVFYTLARFANTDDVCITTISNGRSNLRISNTMGMFVNTLALTAKIGGQSVEDFIKETAQTFEQTLAHEDYPFARIAADYNLTADIMFAYQIGVISSYQTHGQTLVTDNLELNVPKFKIAFYIMEVDGVPSVAVEYDNGRYSEAMMQSLATSVSNAISAFAQASTAALRSISLINEAQLQVLDSFNQTEVPYDDTQTIVSLWNKQVAETPDNIAVVYQDTRLTYREVDERSDAIAAAIIEATKSRNPEILREPIVSILINRSEWMVLAALGALKAGCAYQPLDPSYPAERLNFMMKDANAAVLIADEELRPIVNEYQGPVLLTKDQIEYRPAAPDRIQTELPKPEDLFILLYTSGSTGVPKGVMLEHRNIVAFCHWYKRYYDLKAGDKVAAYASFGFDANMMDLYPALTTGATVYIISEDMRLNLPDLNRYFNEEGVTHSFMTTQVGFQFATNVENHSLRHLSVGGEALAALTPPANYAMHNGYGPTECTIFTTTYQLGEYEQHIPIGKPLDNLRLVIMDSNRQRLPLGAAGELWVSGPQVSRGYLNQHEKTADVYVEWGGVRWYRTGDIVRYLPDGNIQFVGRRDGQVKIRGFRIELKEVEAVIREFPGIRDATVQAFDYPNGGKFIAAYVVSDLKIEVPVLNAFIKERKPSYMVPAATMQIDAIPLNQNQKVNRRALPAPQMTADDREYIAPVNDTEKLFCDIFAGILTMDRVGATDNFFELGGTSLMVTRVIIEADKAGKHIAYADLFSHPTPRQLAELVNGQTVGEEAPDTTITDFDYQPIQELISRNTIETFLQGQSQDQSRKLGHVLLTGATGYLGIHVLYELLQSDAETITCLVRGKSQEDAERRLRNLMFYYFSRRFDDLFGKRLFVVNGDVTQDFLEISRARDFEISTVVNCAANVKHFSKGTDIEDVNIGGAQRCVDFCLKTGAALVHVSTTSTGGVWIGDDAPVPTLTERNIYFGQYLGNQYMHSKFLADRLILDAVAHKGLKAKIMRVGNLAARSYDGEFQVNFSTNSYMGRIKIFNMLGCCPYEQFDQPMEFSPIDETARAIVLLAHTPDECTVFHPYNTHTRLMGDVLAGLEKIGTPMRFVELQEFALAMQQAAQDPDKASMLTTMLAYQGNAGGKQTRVVDRNNEYTAQVLLRLGFRWTEPDSAYVNRMLTAISQLGFFDV
ncbi:MAG: amino acid adenylation domain-containing protein [Paludibacteraceae bacterium]|nr:amino acid adenylation domain-containing protein [Paludibacteraceae bacterium]